MENTKSASPEAQRKGGLGRPSDTQRHGVAELKMKIQTQEGKTKDRVQMCGDALRQTKAMPAQGDHGQRQALYKDFD